MKPITRRLFSRAIPAVAVGAPTALKYPAQEVPGFGRLPPPIDVPTASGIGGKIWNAIEKATRPHQDRQSNRYARRLMMGGLDPDLAVLNSMSLARRVAIQLEREDDMRARERTIRQRIILMMGGNPEDFE